MHQELARIHLHCAMMAGSERLHCVHLLLLSFVSLLLPAAVLGEPCPADACPDLSSHDIDLSPLRGVWEAVYYTQTEGSTVADVPHFFNISVCGAISPGDQCSGSRVCYSDHMDTFYNLGTLNSCKYNYTNRTIQFTSEFSPDANFGQGNTTLTLICGRTLGVPEVIEGSPTSHAIQIVWVTSAACKYSTSLAAKVAEMKCYHVHSYEDNGLKARFIDLSELIKPEGYSVSYSERPQAKVLLSICRPLEIAKDSPHAACNGSMACLIEKDPQLSSSLSAPFVLGNRGGVESNLHMHGNLLATIYTTSGCTEDGGPGNRSVMIHYICPSENQDLGPHITYADDKLCRVEISWYTSFACGNQAIQSTGCTLTTQQGFQFDLTGLEAVLNVTGDPSQHDSSGQPYRYKMRICGDQGLNQLCDARDAAGDTVTHVAQFDSSNTCWSLGGGEGKLRYADGSLTLTYTMGDSCHSNFKRTSVITFVCPKDVKSSGNNNSTSPVTFIGETDCFYRFEWVTDLACGAETSGESSCEFEVSDRSYNFAPLVGTNDENWVAVDDDPLTACFMVHPCGELHVTDEKSDYCNIKKAPKECTGASVCQIFTNGTALPIGKFNLQNSSTIESADAHILSIRGLQDSSHVALIHYVCKTGDLTTPPIFIGKTNGIFYEFHWTTYAACPSGIQPGQSCAVSHKSSGFTFDLSSMKPLTYETSDYTYNVSVCSTLRSNETRCTDGDKVSSSVCQKVHSGGHYSLGKFNDTLIYEDGTLKLHYYNGTRCEHKDKPLRSSTLLFICDSTAHTPTINGITEDYCDYAIDIRTKEACPPAFRTTECIHFSGNKSFDLSELSRTLGSGNWEARGKDGSIYYINVCQPLNKAKGCGPLSAVCRAKTDTKTGLTEYMNLGMASTAETYDVRDGSGKMVGIKLTYKYEKPGGGGSSSGCPTVTTSIDFACNPSVVDMETRPHFVSGGDEANPCHYSFTWDTIAACPLQPKKSDSCQVNSSSGFTFDLSPLSTHNVTLTSATDGFTFDLAVCGALPQACNQSSDVGTVAVCQTDSTGTHHVCGKNSTQVLQYFDGSLSVKYSDGDMCHHVKKKRSVLINFECDRTLNNALGTPRYVHEKDCQYTFEWPTTLACEPQELDCVAAGGKYDLRPLLERKTWKVEKGEVKDDYEYVIGGCRSLDFRGLSKCPQRPGMGACRYSNSREVSGEALGFVTGNIIEVEEGTLMLMYSSGGRCAGGRARMVHVEFHCGQSAGAGVPTLTSVDNTNCMVRIRWVTQYACSRDSTHKASKPWVIKDQTTGQMFDLTELKSSVLTRLYHEGGTGYNYSVGLNGKSVSCPKATKTSGRVGACQTDTSTGKMHALGFITDNTTLDYIGGELRVEYTGGDDCHHVIKSRKAVVTFECDKSKEEEEFLQVLPEAECEYSFVIHTEIACLERGEIGVECMLEGYEDLAGLMNMKVPPIEINSTHGMYVSVCSPLSAANQQDYPAVKDCPASSGACIVDKKTHKVINLGKPSSQHPLKELKGENGVEVQYIEGGMCVKNGTHEIRYTTRLLLICNRNVPIGVPELVAKEEQDCEYIVRWESQYACRIHLPTSKTSKDVCNITDTSLSFSYNFKNLAKERPLSTIDKTTGTTYYIQLCGTASGPLPSDIKGCDHSHTGICQVKKNGQAKTIMHAEHKLAMTSHTPHVIDVYYSSGETCDSDPTRKWTAFLTLQCARGASETAQPVFQPEEDKCELHFVWQNSSFCVGVEACSVEDKKTDTVYNLDGLLSQTWTGLLMGPDEQTKTKEKGGSFSMSICRNLNPYSSSGGHCSTPSGICLHTPDGRHVNLGSLHSSLNISYYRGNEPVIHAMYRDGDVCPFNSGARKYQTDLFIQCGKELSTPLLSVHEDSRQGNCSWSVVINTPLACPPPGHNDDKTIPANDTSCNRTTAAGTYVLPSFAKSSSEFTDNLGSSYTVTLCGSSGQIVQKIGDKSVNLGKFQSMVVSATTNGPRLIYNSGDSCPKGRNQRYKSYIFMECNRSADPKDKKLTLQQDLSEDCEKFFFWSTPYACLAEEVSCSLTIDKGNIFYDFSPLHSARKPWMVHPSNAETRYYINICGAISDRTAFGITDCGPDAAVCKRTRDGVEEIATAGTQQITYTGNGDNVQLQYTGPVSKQCGNGHSHVTIHMQCGIQGLIFNSVSSCNYHFTWSSPYACKASDSHLTTYKTCPNSISGSSNFEFYPKKLSRSYHTTDERGVTYHVNLCGSADSCDDGVSVCVEQSQTKKSIASFKNQTIMADGYQLMFHMSMEGEGKSHAIVRVVCLTQDELDGHQPNTLAFENYAEVSSHQYYHFTIYTKDGCHFTAPSEPPSGDSNGGGKKNGGGSNSSEGGGKSSKNGTVAAILISMTVVIIFIILLAFVLYKKERREYVRKALVYMVAGKSTEAVIYHRVSTFEMDEETALMEDQSGEESGEVSESEIDKKPADGEESDEELLNL